MGVPVTELSLKEVADKLALDKVEKPIKDDKDLEGVNEYLKKTVRCKKDLTEERDINRKPYKRQYDAVNDEYNPFIKKMESTERLLKGQIGAYMTEQDRKAEQARIEEEKKARQHKKVTGETKAPTPTREPEKPAGTSTRQQLSVSIKDVSKIPDDVYRRITKVDPALLNAYIKAVASETGKETHKVKIPGVSIELKTVVSVRA